MLNKLAAFMDRYAMTSPGDTVVCAVSGGADSMALLWAMYLLGKKRQLHVQAAHFNHGLRGAESDRDERFVREFCARYEIPLHIGKGAVAAGEKGLEAAARDARYAFLATLPGTVATAHTADDNAETVLMHMVRGTGLRGLGAIAPVRGQLIRPMLTVTREEVLAFLREYHLEFVEDSSNETDAFLRNRLRHHVMPLLHRENPRLSENLSAMALRLREDEAALSELPEFSEGLSVTWLRQLPQARRSRVLAGFLEHCGVKEPEADHIALAEALVFSEKPSAEGRFPGGVKLCRVYDRLERQAEQTGFLPGTLRCPGVTDFPELGLRVVCRPAEKLCNTEDTFTVCPVGQMVFRPRMPGDVIRLAGGRRPLKKLFIDRKIPAARRMRLPVLADNEGVLGVFSIGVSEDRAARQLPAVAVCLETIKTVNKD